MPDQADEEVDHRLCQARHFDQRTQEHKQRYCQKNQMGHAFLHPVRHDGQRCGGGERQVGNRRQSKGEGNWNPDDNACNQHHQEEDDEIQIAQSLQDG